MYLKEIQLRNYKNFQNTKFVFRKGINTIIGENDSGKTTLMQAIRLVLDKKLEWYEKEISENWFSEGLGDWRGHIIIISLRFDELDSTKEEQAVLKYITGTSSKEGSITWFCTPNSRTRKRISSLNGEELKKALFEIRITDYISLVTYGSNKNYLDDEVYHSIVGNISQGEYLLTEKLDENLMGSISTMKNSGIEYIRNRLVDFTYIDALRDAVNVMHQRYNPLISMLRQIEPKITESDKESVNRLIVQVNDQIGNVDQIKKLSNGINRKIVQSVGNTYAPDIALKSELSGDIKDIFRNLRLKSNQNPQFTLESLGLGSTNIIYIALKLMEYSYIKEMEELPSKYFLLLFEEPEAHLHKHIQMSLFEKTDIEVSEDVQVILTTHSDNISAASRISRMNIILKKKNYSVAVQPANNLTNKQITHLERYLDVKRSELLFSKSVILVEGDAEEILIPIVIKKCFGLSLDELGISLINIGSVGFENVYLLFNEDRITKKCAVVSDLDTPINVGSAGENKAHKLGIERKKAIDDYAVQSSWVRGFFGKHTFEIEIVPNNIECMKRLIRKSYKQTTTITELETAIEKKQVIDYGNAALKIAKHNKKGWNAVLLSEEVDGKFFIPQYLIDALVFVANTVFCEPQNYLQMLKTYAKVYSDNRILEAISAGETNLSTLLTKADESNVNSSVIRILKVINNK